MRYFFVLYKNRRKHPPFKRKKQHSARILRPVKNPRNLLLICVTHGYDPVAIFESLLNPKSKIFTKAK